MLPPQTAETESLTPDESVELTVCESESGLRIDAFLASHFRFYSRTQLRESIRDARVLVDGARVKASFHIRPGQRVAIRLPDRPRERPIPEAIPIDVLFEDDYLAAINKRPGMVVHPARGHWSGTLTGALTHHFDTLSQIGGAARPGIVHRLDRDTSGVIVVAKCDRAHLGLTAQFEARSTEKEYLAITAGVPDRDRDVIERPIGVHPYQREKMAIRAEHTTSRDARTFYEVQERFARFALLRVAPRTGRTHQIRVHLEHIGCPVLCDRLYSGRSRITAGELAGGRESVDPVLLDRQALHAWRLRIRHPITGAELAFEAPLPLDMRAVLDTLRGIRSE
ncbi:MAG: RluA family pseudouridine synthase [Planctomycetes bacterium]|nr:RluA family pseudouridine synthase [Planctomycetota bacterium]